MGEGGGGGRSGRDLSSRLVSPGSTCSPHRGDGRGAVATPPPGPDYSLSPPRPRPALGFRRRFAQVNSCSLLRRRRRRRRQVLSVSSSLPPRRFLGGPGLLRERVWSSLLRRQPPWVAGISQPRPAGSGGGDGAPAGRPGRRRPGPAESAGRGPAEST